MQPFDKRRNNSLDLELSSPCVFDWDEMIGDERERFCQKCELNVYNISAMSKKEAIEFLQNQNKENLCINYFKDTNGRIKTKETPRIIRAVAAFFTLFGLSVTASPAQDRGAGRGWFSPNVYPHIDASDPCKKGTAQNEYSLNIEKKLVAKIDEYHRVLQNAELNKNAVLARVRKIIEQQKQNSTNTAKSEQKTK